MSNAYKEVGTLKDIGARVGDVVRVVGGPSWKIIGGDADKGFVIDDPVAPNLSRTLPFRIISRAHPIEDYQPSDEELIRAAYAKGEECAKPGPVRTVTRLEIIPGSYGNVVVESRVNGFRIKMTEAFYCDPEDLTAAITTLTAIRDAMQANTTA